MSVKRPVDREAVSLRPRLSTPDPLSRKAPDRPPQERIVRVPPRKGMPENPTRERRT